MKHDSSTSMRLFAAIFLDGELNGSPLEGLDQASVAHELIDYFDTLQTTNRTSIISGDTADCIKKQLLRFADIAEQCHQAGVTAQKDDITTIAAYILNELNSTNDIFFPGGWYAQPAGHAMVYRLFYDKQDHLVFLAYNTGDGAQYHKTIDSGEASTFDVKTYRRQFNPVYAIQFNDQEKLKQPGDLQSWIVKLLEPQILPRYDFHYQDNDARAIYQKIMPLRAYLNGKEVEPGKYFPWTTAGQKSGTCAHYSLQQAVRTFLQSDLHYNQFILDYRLHVLRKYLDDQQLPKYFADHYHRAIELTALMITAERDVEKHLTLVEKHDLLNELDSIQQKAQVYFKALPETLKPEVTPPTIMPIGLSIPSSDGNPTLTEVNQSLHSDLVPCQSLLLFNPQETLSDSVFKIQKALEKVDKRLFVYNLEQLCFIFCEKIKDFKTKPLEVSQDDIDTWAKVIQLLHRYSFEYFNAHFKDHFEAHVFFRHQEYAANWFQEDHLNQDQTASDDEDDGKSSTIQPKRTGKKNKPTDAAASPRNQMIGLALMTLQHFAAMQYHGALLDQKENWQATLSHLDNYTAYMQHWMVSEKMQRDFFLSSTDPELSHLFLSLSQYYSVYPHDVDALRMNGTPLMGKILIKHYIQLMQTAYFKEEKAALEALFKEHASSIRSHCRLESDLEHALVQSGLLAIYMYNNPWKRDKTIQWPETPKLKQLIQTHYHSDLAIFLGTKALLYGSTASLGEPSFSIGKRDGLWAITSLTGSSSDCDLLAIPYYDTDDYSSWRYGHKTSALDDGINQIAQGSGRQSWFNCDPLFHDVIKKPYTSNEICLLAEGAQSKIQRHLRTALPLQAVQLLDYFTRHIHLLEERDDQFYLLFSLFQPGVIDQGFANESDLLLALQTLYQKGIALGDLSRDTALLSYRGLFLIKLTSWVVGHVIASDSAQVAYQAYYAIIDEDVRYWLGHGQPEPIQTELQRVLFYNTMRRYPPEALSLPANRAVLVDCLFSYLTLKEHAQDRVLGTITKTEDESFEPLILNLLLLQPQAVHEALCAVLGTLSKDKAPFEMMFSAATSQGVYTFIDSDQQKISVHLFDGEIIVGENNLTSIPTFLRHQHPAYQTVIGSDYDPLAVRINATTYQFEWHNDNYCLTDKDLYKKMNDQWYQYREGYCLPQVLQQSGQFLWVSESAQHALIMQINDQYEFKLVGELLEGQLHLQQPKGVFCLDGDARTQIVQTFNAFESPAMITVVQLDDQPNTHQFQLPYYGFSGHLSSKTGVTIDYEQHNYAVIIDETPFDTGIWLGTPDATKIDRLYLVPIQPFYRQESQQQEANIDVHYRLTHDVQRRLPDNLELEKKYAVFHYDRQGRLTADNCSTDGLYLAYLYCGRYAFDRAYEAISQYIPQGKPEELIYLHWLCDKLPAKLSSNKQTVKEPIFVPDKNAIVTPMLLLIQLKALLLLRRLDGDLALIKQPSQEMLDFLSNQRLIDFTMDVYNKYHRLSDHLSDDKKLPHHDLVMIATDVHLRIETVKQEQIKQLNQLLKDKANINEKITAQKELLLKTNRAIDALQQEPSSRERNHASKKAESTLAHCNSEVQQYQAKLEALDLKIKEQGDRIQLLVVKQHSGYLGLIHAKKTLLFDQVSQPPTDYFITQHTVKYSNHEIQPVWPLNGYQPINQFYDEYQVLKVQDMRRDMVAAPKTIYVSSTDGDDLSYAFLDDAGKKITNSWLSISDASIKDAVLKNSEALSRPELHAIRLFVLSDAIKSNKIKADIGTLHTIKTLMASPDKHERFKAACNQLSLNSADEVLIVQLDCFIGLALEEAEAYPEEKKRLRTFCSETIIACEDLNEALKGLLSEASLDKRRDRLSIAIVLLKALDYPTDFKASYRAVVSECSEYSDDEKLKECSLWRIVSDKHHGFYTRRLQDNRQKPSAPILSQSGVVVPRMHQIKKQLITPSRAKLLPTVDDSALRETHLKLYELPQALVALAQTLNQRYVTHQMARQRVIRSFEQRTDSEKISSYDAVDQQLDALDQSYRKQLLDSITPTLNIRGSMTAIKSMLAGLSADIVDLSHALKQHASVLPLTLQDLLSMRVDQLSGKQAPLDLDRLLLHYASGLDEGYLTSRYVLPALVPLIRRRLTDFLRQVFLYRQYQHILKALADVNTTQDPFEQEEKKLYLAGRVLELAPLQSGPALALFQYQTNLTVRQAQWAMIDRLTKTGDSGNRAEQLMMGEGKTKVILPESIFLKADGSHLALVLFTDALLHLEYSILKDTAEKVYKQKIELFEFDRSSPCDVVSLRRHLADFADIIVQRKGLVMAPGSLQSLCLKRRELVYQAQYYQESSPQYLLIVEQLTILQDIITLFANKADVIADELHKVLDINVELNYSLGEKRSIDSELMDTALDLFDFLASTPIAVADEQDILSVLNGKSLSDFLTDPGLLYHPEELIDKLIDYYESSYLKQHDVGQYSEKARHLLTAEWRVFLRTTLKSKADERYGRSLSEEVAIAIPYAGNNVPTTRLFENFVESMNYTIQMTHLKGVPFSVFQSMMRAWKKSDQQDCLSNQSEAAKRYQDCLNGLTAAERAQLPPALNVMDVTNDAALKVFYLHFQHNKQFIHYALQENILPSIKIYPHKLTSNAIHLTHLVHRIQGVSGTLGNHPTFAKSIRFNQATSFGVRNKIKELLKQKETVIMTRGETNDYQNISALIDMGAHERGKSNQQVAIELAQYFQQKNMTPPMQYVLFFKKDQLAAWKVGGTEADIMMLPSTNPGVIEKYLKVTPEERFTYYAQTNATGTDILQARAGRARVTVDETTTLSDFLQAVMRMRQLFAKQTVEIVISPALQDQLGQAPTLDDLYNCLEQFERDKLASDVFKSACKQLLDVVQNDFERRLFARDAATSIRLFPVFQSLLVGENLTELPAHYGEEKTRDIFQQIKANVLAAWNKAGPYSAKDGVDSPYETQASIEQQCDDIIQQAMTFCQDNQQTSLSFGTEVSIEQQQETQVQVELRIEQQTDPLAELLRARQPNVSWADNLSVDAQGGLTGDDTMRNRLAFIWNNSPNALEMDWSERLWLSTDFYLIHDRQPMNVYPADLPQKPVLSTLFWQAMDTDEVHCLIVSQEEAEVLTKRLTAGNLNTPSCSIWLESTGCQLTLAGARPSNLADNVSYQILKEQISVLDGNVVLLAEKKEYVWFKSDHIPVLQQQMIKQEKLEDITLFVALAKKIQGRVITREETTERVSAKDFMPMPLVTEQQSDVTPQSEQIIEPESTESEQDNTALESAGALLTHVAVDDYPSVKEQLIKIIRALPENSPFKDYGEKILELTGKMNQNMPTGITPDILTNTLKVTYDAIACAQNNDMSPEDKAQKAQACVEQGALIVNLSGAKMPQRKKLAGLLLAIAGVLLVIASITLALVTCFLAMPIAIQGIKLGRSYLSAAMGGAGSSSVGLFATRNPPEIQLQETLNLVAQETKLPRSPG